ncbi:Card1-like endonuclease domain-containing protein [Ferrimonas lipolytica]|uniref:DUF1887 family protein n=1 Tax=Ferrimonas lipolytica TaxID=2724191 RepID=A0A6H1UE66_9GAMM|nr:DUF1887 family CARF protein [Ferrimonas lipolytica]QIZ76506.1 DUF1887 family protein [Ferrimonas lipolytica]
MATHCCVYGRDPVHIVTPLLDDSIDVDQLVLFCANAQQQSALLVKQVLEQRGINVKVKPYGQFENIDTIQRYFSDELTALISQTTEIYFNTTTGDRLITLCAYQVAQSLKIQSYVIDNQRDQLHWLAPTTRSSHPIADKMTIPEFLLLHGSTLIGRHQQLRAEKKIQQLGNDWAAHAKELATGLGKLNSIATYANKSHANDINKNFNDPNLFRLLKDMKELGLISTLTSSSVQFTNLKARQFAMGVWLEQWVYAEVKALTASYSTIQDHGQSVEVERQYKQQAIRNEIDVMLLANNRLHLIECKTKRMGSESSQEAIYKLDTLVKSLGGRRAKGMLISYQPLSASSIDRAKDLGISVISLNQIHSLKGILMRWLDDA